MMRSVLTPLDSCGAHARIKRISTLSTIGIVELAAPPWISLSSDIARGRTHRSKAMGLIVLLIILILVFGGGGFYIGPPFHLYGGGLSLLLVIVVLVLLFRR